MISRKKIVAQSKANEVFFFRKNFVTISRKIGIQPNKKVLFVQGKLVIATNFKRCGIDLVIYMYLLEIRH